MNNLVLVFDQEGQLRREYYIPNRILSNIHGTYSYEMTIGGHQTASPFSNLIRRSTRKPDPQALAWMQQHQQQQQQQVIWNGNNRHPHMWTNNPNVVSQLPPVYGGLSRSYELFHRSRQVQDDNTLFQAKFIAITDDDTLILSNIVDLGLDEETQETAVVNVSRKILFFHLDT